MVNPPREILSGVVVALALIPEAIGFSVVAGVDPKVSLYASVVIACVIAFTGAREGDDFSGDRVHGCTDGDSGARSWRSVPICRNNSDGFVPNPGWSAEAGAADAFRFAIGADRLWECPNFCV